MAHNVCIHVVPDFGGVLITMSSGRNGKPVHRALSKTTCRYRTSSSGRIEGAVFDVRSSLLGSGSAELLARPSYAHHTKPPPAQRPPNYSGGVLISAG